MAFYRRRVSCSRELSVPTLPLCDLDDLGVQDEDDRDEGEEDAVDVDV